MADVVLLLVVVGVGVALYRTLSPETKAKIKEKLGC